MWEQFSMRPDTTRETDRRPTDTSAEVGEVGDTETRTNAEVGETETQPTDTNGEVREVEETEARPTDTNVEVGEVGEAETRAMDTNVEVGEVGEIETRPTDTNTEVADTERRPDLIWDAEAHGLCVRVYADGVKSFIFVYRLNDRQHFIRIGTTPVWSLEAARDRAKKLRSILNQGDDPARYHKQNNVAPVENVIRYIAEHLRSKP
jgi:Arm DNA-binding domain